MQIKDLPISTNAMAHLGYKNPNLQLQMVHQVIFLAIVFLSQVTMPLLGLGWMM